VSEKCVVGAAVARRRKRERRKENKVEK